jgi:hypothetical protein
MQAAAQASTNLYSYCAGEIDTCVCVLTLQLAHGKPRIAQNDRAIAAAIKHADRLKHVLSELEIALEVSEESSARAPHHTTRVPTQVKPIINSKRQREDEL